MSAAQWKLAGAYKAKSSKPTSVPMLGMSLVRLPFCKETDVPSESTQKFLNTRKMGWQETTYKNENLLYKRLHMPLEACP
jgi:hypothetical protein